MLGDFMGMAGTYESRKVGRYDKNGVVISTCSVIDSPEPYETAVSHKLFNDGSYIIVQKYDSTEEANKGHEAWIKKMTAKKLPETIKDVSTDEWNTKMGNSGIEYGRGIK